MTKRTTYTQEFKKQAVELLEHRDKPGVEIARELGIRQNQLYKWREELKIKGGDAFKGPGRPSADKSSEVSRLKQENNRLKEELEILKKAAIFFAKELP
jgi:transposase